MKKKLLAKVRRHGHHGVWEASGRERSGSRGTDRRYPGALQAGKTDASANLAANIFHFGEWNIRDVKTFLKERGINVRI